MRSDRHSARRRTRLGRLAEARHAQERIVCQFTHRDGYELFLGGTGTETVYFLGTFRELSFVYVPLIDALMRSHRVLLHAPIVSRTTRFGPEERAAEALAILNVLGLEQVHVVAWSDAGTALTRLLAKAPARIRSAVYLGTPLSYRRPPGVRSLAKLSERSAVDGLMPQGAAALVVAYFLGGPCLDTRELYPEIRRLGDVAGYLRFSILPCLVHDDVQALSASTPALVLGGSRDRLVAHNGPRELANRLGARFVRVPDGDHLFPFTSAAEVIDEVKSFLMSLADCPADPVCRT